MLYLKISQTDHDTCTTTKDGEYLDYYLRKQRQTMLVCLYCTQNKLT